MSFVAQSVHPNFDIYLLYGFTISPPFELIASHVFMFHWSGISETWTECFGHCTLPPKGVHHVQVLGGASIRLNEHTVCQGSGPIDIRSRENTLSFTE